MALLFMDSFDHYATADLLEKWSASAIFSGETVTIGSSSGRNSSAGLKITYGAAGQSQAYASKTLSPADATCVVGFACRTDLAPAATGTPLCAILDGTTPQLMLVLLSDFKVQVRRGPMGAGGTVLGTSASVVMSLNTFAYVEFKATIHNSAGTYDVRVNGASVLSGTGADTQESGAAQWTALLLGIHEPTTNPGSSVNEREYDDLYVLDGSGSAPWNTFLGDCRVDARYPTAAGATTGWTPSAGANDACVDETAPNDDTDSVSAASSPLTDTYTYQDAPVVGATIYGVQHCLSVKKSDAGTCTVAPVTRHSGTDYVGSTISPGTSYSYGLVVQATNPGTSAQWTEAGFNAAEFGVKRQS
jgi:hypothetical protein